MKRSIELIDQLIVMAEKQDEAWKEIHHKMNKSAQTLGEGSIVFHLKALRELVDEEAKTQPIVWGQSHLEEMAKRHIASPMFTYFSTGELIMGTGSCPKCQDGIRFQTPCPKCGSYISLL